MKLLITFFVIWFITVIVILAVILPQEEGVPTRNYQQENPLGYNVGVPGEEI